MLGRVPPTLAAPGKTRAEQSERLEIPGDVHHWRENDSQFREELMRLKEFQTKEPLNEGDEFDYFVHSSGIQFVLDETNSRCSV
jgi:hypothetical protein